MCTGDVVKIGGTGGGAQETCACPGNTAGGAQQDPCRGGGTHELGEVLGFRGVACLLPTVDCTKRGVGTIPGWLASPVNDLERDISREVGTATFGSDCAEIACTITGGCIVEGAMLVGAEPGCATTT